MSTITIPRADLPAVMLDGSGRLVPSRDLYRWMHDITQRVGGVSGAGTNDLSLSSFEDAGIEETKAALFAAQDALGSAPVAVMPPEAETQCLRAEVEELRGLVVEVFRMLQGINQGVVIQ